MNDFSHINLPQFYLSAPAPCPYLKGQIERKIFTHLAGPRADALNDALTHIGFRRSQTIAYKPACEHCSACISVRVDVRQFTPNRSLKRILNKNKDIEAGAYSAHTTRQQYELLSRYLETRHYTGGMADMTSFEYMAMVEDTSVTTQLVEYYLNNSGHNAGASNLVATALIDPLSDGLSMVYSFFEPSLADRSLGSFMILDQIARARKAGLSYLYLGYWVADCQKMAYKQRFQPLEKLTDKGWQRFAEE